MVFPMLRSEAPYYNYSFEPTNLHETLCWCNPDPKITVPRIRRFVRGGAYCRDCRYYLCNKCMTAHVEPVRNPQHEVLCTYDFHRELESMKRSCKSHPAEKIALICASCDVSMCFKCQPIHDGSNHEVEEVSEYQKRLKMRIEGLQDKAQEKKATLQGRLLLLNEQDAKMRSTIAEKLAGIEKAYEESVRSAKLKKKKKKLIGECNKLGQKLRTELHNVWENNSMIIRSIDSALALLDSGRKYLLLGNALKVHNAICRELEEMLGRDDPEEVETVSIVRQAEGIEFTRCGEEEGELGQLVMTKSTTGEKREGECDDPQQENPKRRKLEEVEGINPNNGMSNAEWNLVKVRTFRPQGGGVCCMAATSDGWMAVAYAVERKGGIGLFTPGGAQTRMLKSVEFRRICALPSGRYFFLESHYITKMRLYSSDWKKIKVQFYTAPFTIISLCDDKYDNIYVGYRDLCKIGVFRPEGGASVREIDCNGFVPEEIYHMNNSNTLVVSNRTTLRLIDATTGAIKLCTLPDAKRGLFSSMTVLRNDQILISWKSGNLLSIDLYTPDLKFVGSVINNFTIDPSPCKVCMGEFTTGRLLVTTGVRFISLKSHIDNDEACIVFSDGSRRAESRNRLPPPPPPP